ncbi:MAG: carboxylesterase family protein [Lachnospiraceae bacterium]|nr:carboxylesterase family protein [Lachnospiraceae bacterium]
MMEGRIHDVAYLFGHTYDEGSLFNRMFRGSSKEEDVNPFTLFHGCFAQLMAEQGRTAYTYVFRHDIPGEDRPGAYHGSDLWFVFDSLGRCWRPFEGKHYDLARQVSSYWVNFVKYQDPNGLDCNGEKLPSWHNYTGDRHMIMIFGDEPHEVEEEDSEQLRLKKQEYMGRTE